MAEHVADFETESAWVSKLSEYFDWEGGASGNNRMTATVIYEQLTGNSNPPTPLQITEIGHAMNKLWRQSGAVEVDGVTRVNVNNVSVQARSLGGKNLGWITPARFTDRLPAAPE